MGETKAVAAQTAKNVSKKSQKKKTSFFEGVKKEWGRITWDSGEDIRKKTWLTIIISILTAVVITAVDFGGQEIVNLLLSL